MDASFISRPSCYWSLFNGLHVDHIGEFNLVVHRIAKCPIHRIGSRFEHLLNDYFKSDQPQKQGLPSVKYCAHKLNISANYLGDLLKNETGKSTQEHVQLRLIEVAKEKMFEKEKTVSQIAYELGFEYPQYFSRLFKKRIGMTPNEYRGLPLPTRSS